jgi:hypothetical protein
MKNFYGVPERIRSQKKEKRGKTDFYTEDCTPLREIY